MALAVGHLSDDDVCVLDAILEVRAPFNPEVAVAECAAMLRRFGIARVVGDRYAGEWPKARFAEHGITFEQSARPKSDIYCDLLPLLNARRVELLDHSRLSAQLVGLERRTARSGKDSVDHSPGGHDDLINAAAGVLVRLDLDRRPALIRPADILSRGSALAIPRKAKYVYAVIVCDKRGTAAVVYGARTFDDHPPLAILDFDVQPFHGALFGEVAERLRVFGDETKSSAGSFAFVQAHFLHHARLRGCQPKKSLRKHGP
jgi:hypothetical protein